MLSVHPSGFYVWVKEPLSLRAREDRRQIKLLKKAWKDSGKVYGYRKIYDDLIDMGEVVSENRVARLARIAGLQAQIGLQEEARRLWRQAIHCRGQHIGPTVRRRCPRPGLGDGYHLSQNTRRLRVSLRRH